MIEFAGMHETLLDDIGVGAGSLYMGSCQSRQAASNDVRAEECDHGQEGPPEIGWRVVGAWVKAQHVEYIDSV
jgi:hypothetical protein